MTTRSLAGGLRPTSDSVEEPSNVRPRSEWPILVTVTLTTTLAPLNSTMIVVALPHIIHDFHVGVGDASWLITLYLVVMASVQPVAGKLGDRLGRRPLVLWALALFCPISLAAALAPNLPVLILFRVLQGAAAAVALPNGMALVREVIPAERRASRFGVIGAITGTTAALGPPLGGAITQLVGWRSIFAVNLLIVIPAFIVGLSLPTALGHRSSRRFDSIGALWLSLLLVGTAALITFAGRIGAWTAAIALVLVGLGTAFVRYEFRQHDPVVQPRYFRRPVLAGGIAAIGLSNMGMYMTLLAVPLLLGQRQGISAAQVGFVIAALSATSLVFGVIGGKLSDRFGRRRPALFGLTVFTLGLAPMIVLGENVPILALLICLAIGGSGLGLTYAGLQAAVVEAVEASEAGVVSGLYSSGRYLGGIVGAGLLAALLVGAHPAAGRFTAVFLTITLAGVCSVVACLFLQDRPCPA